MVFKEAGAGDVEHDQCIAFLKKKKAPNAKTLGSRLVGLGPTQTVDVSARTRTSTSHVDRSGIRMICGR